ncbi:hypothetical protein [Burkholderia thailandensis]|uniref:hypothetical protein n=1 Tax=Burkholderia thailandensis TaxID=57975 RepID=UPI0013898530|nr:hypothetical protein [Burkholderia thailandensis]
MKLSSTIVIDSAPLRSCAGTSLNENSPRVAIVFWSPAFQRERMMRGQQSRRIPIRTINTEIELEYGKADNSRHSPCTSSAHHAATRAPFYCAKRSTQ